MRCLHATRLVFVACMLAAACAGAAPPSLPATTFTALDTRAGLPAPDVFAIAQDAEGFMWFATVSGLARFDGMEMKVYRHREGDAGKLVDDEVGALFRDRQDRLWAATNAGLCRVRAPSDDFDCTRGEQGELAGLRTLAQSGDGALWMGGDGLVRFDPATGATRHYPLPEGGEQALDRLVLQVLIDTRGRTWVGSLRHGLFRFDAGTGNFTPVVLGPITKAKTTAHAAVRSVYEDRKARIWVGTDGGLTRLDGEGRLEAFYDYNEQDPGDPRSLSDNYVDSIFEDRDGNLWIGTHTRGINRYVPAADCFRRYRLREQRTLETDDDPVYAMFQDATGLLWFAGKGLHRLDLDSERLLRHKPPRGDPGEGSVANPEQLMVDAAGVVFIGGGAGLVRYDPAHEEWARHLLFPHDTHFANNRPSALLAGTDEFRYVAGPGGIWLYREDKRDFGESFLTNPGRPTALLIDRANVLWAATSAHGLVRYGAAGEPDQTVYRHDPANTATLSSGFEYFLHEDAHGRFWVGTATGLDLLDRGSGSVHRFPYDPRDPHGPPHREFRAVAESAEGTLWFGTGRGITRLDAAAQRFQSWSVRDGLPHDRVNALTVDRGGALWIGTDAGLARFDPATQGFHNLFREQGLPSDRVRRLALAPDGRLFIATDSGLVSLDPGEFAQPPVAPQVGIAGLRLQGEPMPLDRVESSDRITLKHADDVTASMRTGSTPTVHSATRTTLRCRLATTGSAIAAGAPREAGRKASACCISPCCPPRGSPPGPCPRMCCCCCSPCTASSACARAARCNARACSRSRSANARTSCSSNATASPSRATGCARRSRPRTGSTPMSRTSSAHRSR
jgi:ligand-binding sensor domain-containing protein